MDPFPVPVVDADVVDRVWNRTLHQEGRGGLISGVSGGQLGLVRGMGFTGHIFHLVSW